MGGVVFPIFAQPPVISLVNEIAFVKQLGVERARLFLVIVDDIADDCRCLDARHCLPPLHLVGLMAAARGTLDLASAGGPRLALSQNQPGGSRQKSACRRLRWNHSPGLCLPTDRPACALQQRPRGGYSW